MSSLQEAIDASLGWAAAAGSSEASVMITMHAEAGIWLGIAQPVFLADVPLRDAGPASVETATTGIGRWFEKQPAPGFSTRGYSPHDTSKATNYFKESQGNFTYTNQIWMDFSVRKDPGVPIVQSAAGARRCKLRLRRFRQLGDPSSMPSSSTRSRTGVSCVPRGPALRIRVTERTTRSRWTSRRLALAEGRRAFTVWVLSSSSAG